MPAPPSRRLRWFRLLHRLGFRWAFPIGTLAVPYHPVVVRLLPWVPPVLVVWGALGGGLSWWVLLAAAALVGLALSVPVLFYVLVVFRFPLLQGSLLIAALLLIAVDVAAGSLGWAWGLLPAAYVADFLVQSVGGEVALRRQRRRNQGAIPVDPSGGVTVEGPERHDAVRWLLEDSDVARASDGSWTWMRVHPDRLARAEELVSQVRSEFAVEGEVLKVPGRLSAPVTVRVRRPSRSWLSPVSGDRVRAWDVEDGDRLQRLLSGPAEVVGRVPLFICFYFWAIFGGRSRWFVGFVRRSASDLGDGREVLLRAFPPRAEPPSYADATAPLAALEEAVVEGREQYLRTLERVERTPDHALPRLNGQYLAGLDAVRGEPTAGTGTRLCDLVDRAKEGRQRLLAEAAARALSGIPSDELRALTPRLLRITGSRILSLQWKITPDLDVAPLPRDLPRFGDFGGFGLLTKVPDLYRRLGELDDPQVPRLLEGLADEAGWTPALDEARAAYATRHPS